jgi:hypothetical protein
MEITKDDGSFVYLSISNRKISYELHFFRKDKKSPKVAEIYALPYKKKEGDSYLSRYNCASEKMKISIDGASVEIPFTKGVIEDEFTSYIATLVIANSKITFDVDEFSEDMFPEDECHCR